MKKIVSLAAGAFITAAAFSMLSTGTASAQSYDECQGRRVELAWTFGALVPPCIQQTPGDDNSWAVDVSQLPSPTN